METQIIKLLETEDVADILGCTKEYVTKVVRLGLLKTHGSLWNYGDKVYLVLPEDLWEFIQARKTFQEKISREDFDKKVSDIFA